MLWLRVFQAYAAGCDIVILASDFQRVQIIPGAIHGNIQVSGIDCCSDAGKVRACTHTHTHTHILLKAPKMTLT